MIDSRWGWFVMACLGTGAASAQPAADREGRTLAASSASCHGQDGRAVAGELMPRLAGLPQEYLVAQMQAFKSGTRQATVMHQIAKGYSERQIEAMSAWFSTRK